MPSPSTGPAAVARTQRKGLFVIRNLMRVLLAGGLAIVGTAAAAADAKPVIEGYGAIAPMPGAREKPEPTIRYRVLFDVTAPASAPDQVNPGLEKVARFINLLGSEGIRPPKGDVVVIVHGAATPIVLVDARYVEKTKAPLNPNLRLIEALRDAGVSIRVCSQALHGQGIVAADVASAVQIDLSALTTLASLQLRGWALIPD